MSKQQAESLAQRVMQDWQPMAARVMKARKFWMVVVQFTAAESYTFYTAEQFEDYGRN